MRRGDTSGPGNAPYRVLADAQNWPVREIIDQIRLTRQEPGASGNVHFNMSAFLRNRGGLVDSLTAVAYTMPAVVPASDWLDDQPPAAPLARADAHPLLGATLTLEPAPGEPTFLWAIRMRLGEQWFTDVVPAQQRQFLLLRGEPARVPDEIVVSAIDRTGKESSTVRLEVIR